VADQPPHGATKIEPNKGHSGDGGGGGAGRWLLGGLAALVLVGGGYAAYKTVGPGQQDTQSAYNESYDDASGDDPLRAGPLPGDDNLPAESSSLDDSNTAPAPAAERRSTTRRSTPVRAAEVPEETIGITPINATSDDVGDDIVVRGQRRPVWSRVPNERSLTALYPERARMRGREGEARLQCTVQDGGVLDCVRSEETSSQFGAAAIRVARTYRHAPTLRDGTDATGTPVNLRVVFRLEDEERGRG
jgi:TonB family protein